MRPSRYNFLVDLEEGGLLVYNTLYGSFSLLEVSEKRSAAAMLRQESSPSPPDEGFLTIRQALFSQKHLVPDDTDELAEIRARKLAGVEDTNRLDLVLLPTLNCNFACTYCYEDHRKDTLTPETEHRLLSWMERNLHQYRLVMLHWFGGEPLTRVDQMLRITLRAQALTSSEGSLLIPHVTTNGYLLKSDTVGKLIRAGIRSFQITLDGPPETHDRLRILRNGGPTFSRVYAGILQLASAATDVKISVRVNFNHTNILSIPDLLERFPEELRPQLRVVFEPVFGESSQSAMENLSPEEVGERLASYYRQAESLGYDITFSNSSIRPGRLVYCYAERENQLIIGPTGDVFKCSVSKFEADDRVGYLASDGRLVKENEKWNEWVEEDATFEKACLDCVFLPLCMGGCRKRRMTASPENLCPLAPTNASYILKQVAFGRLSEAVRSMVD